MSKGWNDSIIWEDQDNAARIVAHKIAQAMSIQIMSMFNAGALEPQMGPVLPDNFVPAVLSHDRWLTSITERLSNG